MDTDATSAADAATEEDGRKKAQKAHTLGDRIFELFEPFCGHLLAGKTKTCGIVVQMGKDLNEKVLSPLERSCRILNIWVDRCSSVVSILFPESNRRFQDHTQNLLAEVEARAGGDCVVLGKPFPIGESAPLHFGSQRL